MSGARVGGSGSPFFFRGAAEGMEEVATAARARASEPYNRGHRKKLVEVPLVSRNVLRRDGNGNPLRGGPGRGAIVDGVASVDLTTLTPNGMILAFHADSKGRDAGENSAMIRVQDIKQPFRSRILREARRV